MCLLILEPARTKMSPKRRAVKIASLYESRAAPFGHGAGCFAVTVIIAFKRQKADQRVWKIGKRIVENDAGDARCIWEGESAGIVPRVPSGYWWLRTRRHPGVARVRHAAAERQVHGGHAPAQARGFGGRFSRTADSAAGSRPAPAHASPIPATSIAPTASPCARLAK